MAARLLAIDPGVHCGYCWIDIPDAPPPGLKPGAETAGVWELKKNRFGNQAMRYLELEKQLRDLRPDLVIFEAVNFLHKSTQAARMYYGLVAIIERYCETKNIMCTGIDVSKIKKRATGRGRAHKLTMIKRANEFFELDPPLDVSDKTSNVDDNIADAMWLCQLGIDIYGEVLSKQGTNNGNESSES